MNKKDLDSIFETIDGQDKSGLMEIINSGKNLNVIHDLREQTPLICAIDNNWITGVKILIEAGVDVNQSASHESNPLLSAVAVNNIDIVEILLDNGADPYNNMCLGIPLHDSIRDGKIHIAQTLVQRGANVNNQNESGYTTLMVASHMNNLSFVKTLIAAGADPNIAGTKYQETALVMAARNGHLDIFEYLLPLTTDEKQREYAYQELSQGLLFRKRCNDRLIQSLAYSASINDTQELEQLIAYGFDVNKFNQQGKNALHIASSFGNVDIVNLLIEAGSDLDLLSESGDSAVQIATRDNQENVLTSLIKAGANLAIEDGTLLIIAAARNCIEVAQVLIDFGIDINAKDGDGNTALEIARRCGNVEMVELLRKAGAVGRYDIEVNYF